MTAVDYLDIHDLLAIAQQLIPSVTIRDYGLLESAAARPRTTVFGDDAYPTLVEKVAALMHSLGRNHCLVDGNKRLTWAAGRIFCLMNGHDLQLTINDAEALIQSIAQGRLDAVELAGKLQACIRPI